MDPSVEELRTFDLVARRSSFAEAARELRISPALVTRRVASLEAALGVRLLTRTTRQVRLTMEGQTFAERARGILTSIEDAVESMQVARSGPSGTLRLSAPLSFGRRHVAPVVAAFAASYPDIVVALCLNDSEDDFGARETDLAIRIGLPAQGAFITRRLLSAKRAIVASPGYIAERGMPLVPSDLTRHRCLAVLRDGRPIDQWMVLVDGQQQSQRVPVALSSNSGEIVHRWARDGAGIALKSMWDLEEDLANGQLVEVLGDYVCDRADLFLIYPDRRALPARVRLFIDFLTAYMDSVDRRLNQSG